MARKKKKLSRKEKIEQRRATVEAVRKERGWEPPAPQSGVGTLDRELLADMRPLLPPTEDAHLTSSMVDDLMMAVLDSGDMAEEPELEAIMAHPFHAVETFIEAGEELGWTPETLGKLPPEEQADRQGEIMELTAQRLLTAELRQDIIAALEQMRQRLKRSGDEQKIARAAALQSFLKESSYGDLLPMIGLVRAIVQRSLTAGFELMEASMGIADESRVGDDDSILTVRQKLEQSHMVKKTESVLKKIPGLSGFLEKFADQTWEEGMAALFRGDLYLELFTQEEIEGGIEVFQEAIGNLETEAADSAPVTLSQDKARTLTARMGEYVTELMTPERLERLRDRVSTVIEDRAYSKWLPFLFMFNDALAEEDVLEKDMGLLVSTFIGELRTVSSQLAEEEEEAEPTMDSE